MSDAPSVHLSQKANLSASIFAARIGPHQGNDYVLVFITLVHIKDSIISLGDNGTRDVAGRAIVVHAMQV